MTVREILTRHMTDHGLSDPEADQVLTRWITTERLTARKAFQNILMDQEVGELFYKVLPIILFGLDQAALEWMRERRPNHPSRSRVLDNVESADPMIVNALRVEDE